MALDVQVRLEGLEGVLKTLEQLPREIVSKHGGPVRVALRKASLVLLNEAKANVQRIIDTPNKDGRNFSIGLAVKSIIAKRVRPRGGQKGEAFLITVKPNKYPARREGTGSKFRVYKRKGRKAAYLQANDVLFMLEHGTERRPPMPWLRPAYEAKREEALAIFERELPAAIERIQKRLARQNGVKR